MLRRAFGSIVLVFVVALASAARATTTCPTSGTDVTIGSDCQFDGGTYSFGGTLTINATVTVSSTNGNAVVLIAPNISVNGALLGTNLGYNQAQSGSGGGATPCHGGKSGGGGTVYGSITGPVTPGGGSGSSARGGAAVKLSASGTVSVQGSITMDGLSCSGCCGSFGAGGSVWIDAATFSGSGSISAQGGSRTGCTGGNTGAGGGRVAVYYATDSSSILNTLSGAAPRIAVNGGTASSGRPGGAGTLFVKVASTTYGDLFIDNADRSYFSNVLNLGAETPMNESLTFNRVWVKRYATLSLDNTMAALDGVRGYTTNSGILSIPSSGGLSLFTNPIIDGVTVNNSGQVNLLAGSITITNGTFTHAGTADTGAWIIGSGGVLKKSGLTQMTMTSLDVQSGGTVTHVGNTGIGTNQKSHNIDIVASGAINVASGGIISANALGYDGLQGPASAGAATVPGGGGHGGRGGDGYNGATLTGTGGGPDNDSATNPTYLGSGGGKNLSNGNVGGIGGGEIRLQAATVTVAGTISANGQTPAGNNGGGAGGTVRIIASTIGGAGTVSANGGAAGGSTAGCGGGGRVAIDFGTNNLSSTPTAAQGTCTTGDVRRYGTPGTVSLNQQYSVAVGAPNGGNSLAGNDSYSVTWTQVGAAHHYRVSLSTNGGGSYPTVLSSSTTSPFVWTVTNSATTTARIKVEALDAANTVLASDTSDSNFTISASSATLSAPNGSESLAGGQKKSITWTGAGLAPVHYRLTLSTDGGATYPTSISTSATSPHTWTVPSTTTTQARVKVELLNAANTVLASDVSDASFSITPSSVTLTAPTGGETLTAGTSKSITWTSAAPAAGFRVSLSTNGTTFTALSSNATAPYAWTVPATGTNTAKIRVEALDSDNTVLASATSSNFTILAATVTVTTPNGGNSLALGASSNVAWTTTGLASSFRVKLSTDSGATFPTTLGSGSSPFVWSNVGPLGTHVRVRVEALDGSGVVLASDDSNSDFTIYRPCGAATLTAIADVTLQDAATAQFDVASHVDACGDDPVSWSLLGGDGYVSASIDGGTLTIVPTDLFTSWQVPLYVTATDSYGSTTVVVRVTHEATPLVIDLTTSGPIVIGAEATLTARVTSLAGLSVAGLTVTFSRVSGAGQLVESSVITDANGFASSHVVATAAGDTTVRATVRTVSDTVVVAAAESPARVIVKELSFYDPVTHVRVYPGAANPTPPGSTLEVHVLVMNDGGLPAAAGTLEVADRPASGSERLIASAVVPALAAHASTTFTFTGTFDDAGFHTLAAETIDGEATQAFWIGPQDDSDVIAVLLTLGVASDHTIKVGRGISLKGRADYRPFLPFDLDHSKGIAAVKGGRVTLTLTNAAGQTIASGTMVPASGDDGTYRALHTIGSWPGANKSPVGRFPNRDADDTWRFAAPTTLGSYTLRACVSDESFTGCAEETFTVIPNGPALTCEGLKLPGTPEVAPTIATATTVSTIVSNEGDAAATDFSARLTVDGTTIAQQTLTLAAGSTTTVVFPWTPACAQGFVRIVLSEGTNSTNCGRSTSDLEVEQLRASDVRACYADVDLIVGRSGSMPVGAWTQSVTVTSPTGAQQVLSAGRSGDGSFHVAEDLDLSSAHGTWRIDALVDAPVALPGTCGAVVESNELANNTATVTLCANPSPWRERSGPNWNGTVDLVIAPLPVRYGESTTVTARITNWGNLTLADDLEVKLVSDDGLDLVTDAANDIKTISNTCATGMEPGQTRDVAWTWTPVYGLGAEPRNLRVVVDPRHLLSGTCATSDDETTRSLSFDLSGDLAAGAPSFGQADTVTAHILHSGSIAPNGEGAVARVAFVRKNGSEVAATQQAIVRPPETLSWSWTPSAAACSGNNDLKGLQLTIDATNVYAESNETNNVFALNLPDLQPTAITQSVDGCGSKFSFTVASVAPSPSLALAPWRAKLWLTRPDGVELGPFDGGPYNGSGTFDIASGVDTSMGGTWGARVAVDTATTTACGDLPEGDEANNSYTTTLSLCANPTPQMVGVSIEGSDAQFDHATTLTLHVRNAGTTPLASPVAVRLSTDTVDPETNAANDTVTLPLSCANAILPGQDRSVTIDWTPRHGDRPHKLFATTEPLAGECTTTDNVAERVLWLDLSPWQSPFGMNYLTAIDVSAVPNVATWGGAMELQHDVYNRRPSGNTAYLSLVPNGGAAGVSVTSLRRMSGELVPVGASEILAPKESDPQEVAAAWILSACDPEDGLASYDVDVDPLGFYAEDVETNNHTERPFPDLAVSGIARGQVHNQVVDFSYSVSQGIGKALGVGPYTSSATVTAPDGAVTSFSALSGTIANVTVAQNGTWTVAVDADAGGGACGEVPEQDEQNNHAEATFDLCPDVTVSLTIDAPIVIGQPTPLTVVVHNAGNNTLVEDVDVTISADGASPMLDALTKTLSFAPGAGLEPQASGTLHFTWTPSDAAAVAALRATALVHDSVANGANECRYDNNSDDAPVVIAWGCAVDLELTAWSACGDGHWAVDLVRPTSGAAVPSAAVTGVHVSFTTASGALVPALDGVYAGDVPLPGALTNSDVTVTATAELADGSLCGATRQVHIAPGRADLHVFSEDIHFVSKNGATGFFNQAAVGDDLVLELAVRNGASACVATNVSGLLLLNLGFQQSPITMWHLDHVAPGETAIALASFAYEVADPSPWLDVFESVIVGSDNTDRTTQDDRASRALLVGDLSSGTACDLVIDAPIDELVAGSDRMSFRVTDPATGAGLAPNGLAHLGLFVEVDGVTSTFDVLAHGSYAGNGRWTMPVSVDDIGETVTLTVVAHVSGGSCNAVRAFEVGGCDESYVSVPAPCSETDVCGAASGHTRCEEGHVVVDCDDAWVDIAERGDATCNVERQVVYAIVDDRQGDPAGTIRCVRDGGSPTCDTRPGSDELIVYDGLYCPQ